jgi:cephalosporin-C deacetylase-like acetyl esterase
MTTLLSHLDSLAAPLLAANHARREAIRTPEQWWQRRRELHAAFMRALGPFPDRTPLNAEVVGTLEGSGYVIEKVIFESRPRFYVTANLYRPTDARVPAPGILVPCGHSENGKAYTAYQAACIGLALRGYTALIYDPLGQGERKQFWDPLEGRSAVGGSCVEHSHADNLCCLTGTNLAQYMIWDSIRALDYLISRDEVDASRIGCTGCSGGGTNTTYVAALDERIQAAAPVCYVTDLEARQASRMIADGEQNLSGQLADGLDHHDLSMMVAPRHLLICATEEDFFPLAGARETAAATADLYALLGIPNRVGLSISPGGHGFSADVRNTVVSWFDDVFGLETREMPDPETLVRPDEDLLCTQSGQIATSLRGETAFSLNARRAVQIAPPEPLVTDAGSARAFQGRVRSAVKRLLALPDAGPPGTAEYRVLKDEDEGEYRRLHLSIVASPGLELPAYALVPRVPASDARPVMYAGDGGAAAAIHPMADLPRRCVATGATVLALDLRGLGEAADRTGAQSYENADEITRRLLGTEAFADYYCRIMGSPLLGQRVGDLLAGAAVAGVLAGRPGTSVALIGAGRCGIVALHAAALCECFAEVTLQRTLWSYRLASETKLHTALHASDTVFGALREYDLPQLAAAVAPRSLRIEMPVDAVGEPLCAPELPVAHAGDPMLARTAYHYLGGSFVVSS